MIHVRSKKDIEKIKRVCRIAAEAMSVVHDKVVPGVTTGEIADAAREYIESRDAKAAFLGYNGFPGAICLSVNDEIVHGIPGDRRLAEGDLLKIDLGTYKHGFYGDMARTYAVGAIPDASRDLMEVTEKALYTGIGQAVHGNRVEDIGNAVQKYVESRGYQVVRALVGHGIGRNLHEDPQVPNFGRAGHGPLLKSGMVLAIEPMVNVGTWDVDTLEDDWTVVTADRSLSAHFENTVIVRDGSPEIATLMDGEVEWQKMIQ